MAQGGRIIDNPVEVFVVFILGVYFAQSIVAIAIDDKITKKLGSAGLFLIGVLMILLLMST